MRSFQISSSSQQQDDDNNLMNNSNLNQKKQQQRPQQQEQSSSSSTTGSPSSSSSSSSSVVSSPFLLLIGCCLLSVASILSSLKTSPPPPPDTTITTVAGVVPSAADLQPSAQEVKKKIFQDGLGTLRIPTPIFVASLPKSGTTSTWKYFACGLGKGQAAHTWANLVDHANNSNKTSRIRLGKCFQNNLRAKRPILAGCGNYKVWTDSGYMAPGVCFYPTIHEGALQAFVEENPNATLLQVVRNTEAWVNSTSKFNDLWKRWNTNNCKQFPTSTTADDNNNNLELYGNFYEWHTRLIRQFAKDHPSLTYIEVSLESNKTPTILQDLTGINASCWMNKRPKSGSHLTLTQKRNKNKKNNKD